MFGVEDIHVLDIPYNLVHGVSQTDRLLLPSGDTKYMNESVGFRRSFNCSSVAPVEGKGVERRGFADVLATSRRFGLNMRKYILPHGASRQRREVDMADGHALDQHRCHEIVWPKHLHEKELVHAFADSRCDSL